MNGEKVKEIKKALEFMMKLDLSNKLPYIDGYTPKQIAYEEIFNYINELEEYIKGNEQDAKAFVNGWKKDLETELKQFAERLKEKEQIKSWIVSYDEICNAIDETLKEFLSGGKTKQLKK